MKEVDVTGIGEAVRRTARADEIRPRFRIGRNEGGRISLIDIETGEDFGRLVTDVEIGVSCDAMTVVLELLPGVVEFARLDAGHDR